MPKYYVSSGDLQVTIAQPTAKQAALLAFLDLQSIKHLDTFTIVSEQGFGEHEEDEWFMTADLLGETNQSGDFKNKEWL